MTKKSLFTNLNIFYTLRGYLKRLLLLNMSTKFSIGHKTKIQILKIIKF